MSVIGSTVLLELRKPGTPLATGRASGVIVTENGWVVTNRHVVVNADGTYPDIRIIPTGSAEQPDLACSFVIPARGFLPSTTDDLALIIPPIAPPCHLTPARLSVSIPSTGTRISLVGYPATALGGNSITVTSGQVAGRIGSGTRLSYLKTDAKLIAGYSGGPVIDDAGNVIGIIAAITFNNSNPNLLSQVIQDNIGLIIPAANILQSFPELRNPPPAPKPAIQATQNGRRKRRTRTRKVKMKKSAQASVLASVTSETPATPCTLRAWTCTVIGPCTDAREQVQKCDLVDTMCSNPERVQPPGYLQCIPGKKKLEEMFSTIIRGIAVSREMDNAALRLTPTFANQVLRIRNQYIERLEQYADIYVRASEDRDVFRLEQDTIPSLEQTLRGLETQFKGVERGY